VLKRTVSFLTILLTDLVSLIISFHLAYYIRVEIVQDLLKVSNPYFFPLSHFYKMYYLLFVFILIFSYEKLYAYKRRYDFFEEFVYIIRGLFMSVILIVVLVYLSRSFEMFTRTIPVLMMMTAMVVVPLFRYIVKKLLTVSGFYTCCAAVLGLKEETAAVLPILRKMESSGSKITHVLEPSDTSNEITDVETLIIVPKGIAKDDVNRLINGWENRVKEIKIVSDSGYLKTIGVETEYIEELLVMRMANNLLSPFNRFLKRLFDLLVSSVAIVLLLPVFLIIACIIKLDSRGTVFYNHDRFGKEGEKFRLFKFRTMYVDGDQKLVAFLEEHQELKEEWDRFKKLKSHDPRITGVGRFLRRFSLDESPQLFNVFKGDMSIVGPRPYLVREKEDIQQSAAIIFRVKSGITGLWQIKGRNDLSFESRLKLDEFYVRNWSFLLDITIILKTFGAVIKGKGAY
jgi:Undecaprenyl-phosphate galactose phosphotransferase WbaP